MDDKQIFEALKEAINRFYKQDVSVWQNIEGMEQACVFRIGLYLYEKLKDSGLDIDCEYNRRGNIYNHIEQITKDKIIKHIKSIKDVHINEDRTITRAIRPDLIIHKRGNDTQNILAIEFKGFWNHNNDNDIEKLKSLTLQYDYKLGVFVRLDRNNAQYCLFKQGKQLSLEELKNFNLSDETIFD